MKHTREVVEQVVKQTLSDMLGVGLEEVKDDSNILSDLGADSLDIVELIMECEEHFEIELTDEEAVECETVLDVVDLIVLKGG